MLLQTKEKDFIYPHEAMQRQRRHRNLSSREYGQIKDYENRLERQSDRPRSDDRDYQRRENKGFVPGRKPPVSSSKSVVRNIRGGFNSSESSTSDSQDYLDERFERAGLRKINTVSMSHQVSEDSGGDEYWQREVGQDLRDEMLGLVDTHGVDDESLNIIARVNSMRRGGRTAVRYSESKHGEQNRQRNRERDDMKESSTSDALRPGEDGDVR